MCGIAGIVDYEGRFGSAELLRIATRMRDTLTHRGPDDAGVWIDPTGICALAHRRLSILDLSEKGRQPMVTGDGQVGLVFNGEIYNFAEQRRSLEQRGYEFNSNTDSETLLHLFASTQPDNLSVIDGMYAFAVWNASTRRLLLARDPFGKKPLYIARGRGYLAFASELQAMGAIPGFAAELDPDAIAEYLLLQYVHAPRSIYRGCEKLEPGSWKVIDFSSARSRERSGRHFEFKAVGEHVGTSPYQRLDDAELDRMVDQLRPTVLNAVSKRLQSDVPLGAFLSGGVDSAVVVAMLTRELGQPVKSFSIGFEGSPESEHLEAREAAGLLGTEHHEKMLSPRVVDMLPTIADALDEPLGDSSCLPTYLLSKFAREHVTVVLSGDGGDELFGGYGRYRETLNEEGDWRRRARFLIKHRRPWAPSGGYCSLRWLMFDPAGVESLAGPDAGRYARALLDQWRPTLDDPSLPLITRMRNLDARTYMPGAVLAKVDRMSMAVSLEVRSPLLDRALAEAAMKLGAEYCFDTTLTKPLLRRFAAQYLPKEYVARPKRGFGLPGQSWNRGEVLGYCEDSLLAPDSRLGNVLDREGLKQFVAHQRQEGCFSIFQVFTVLMLEAWLRSQASRWQPSKGDK